MGSNKKTIIFHHEFLALLRLIPPEKAMETINALCDIDLGREPNIIDPSVANLVETKRGSVIEEREKYEEAVERLNKARKNKKNSNDEVSPEINTEINTEINDEVNVEVYAEINDEVSPEINLSSSSSSSSSSSFLEKKEKERAPSLPPFLNPNFSNATGPPEKNYAMIFEEVKAKWKEVVGQETRETLFTVSPAKRERFVNALAIYSVEDIFNAIGNYQIMRNDPEEFDIGGRTYGNLIGFLENGVSQFFEDGAAETNFRRRRDGG
jgi:hypothetical protein